MVLPRHGWTGQRALLLGGFLLDRWAVHLSGLWTLIDLSIGGRILLVAYVALLLWFKLPEASDLLARFQGVLRRRAATRSAS